MKINEREKIIEELKQLINEGDTIYTILRSVAKSGLSRVISFYVLKGEKPIMLDWYVAKVLDERL